MTAPALALLALVAAPALLSPDDLARLARGETVVRLDAGEETPSEGFAAAVLRRAPDRVLRAVSDLDHWQEWVPFLEASEPEPSGAAPSWLLRFDLPLPLRDRHYRVRAWAHPASDGGATVSWHSLPGTGNVAWSRGSFTVAAHGEGDALVLFRTVTDTGDRTPRFLLDRALRESLPWVLEGLAQQVNRCRYTVPRPDGCRETPARTLPAGPP